jgi:hypothetical protein
MAQLVLFKIRMMFYKRLIKQIVTLSHVAHIKLSATECIKSHRFTLSPSNLLLLSFTACYTTPTSHSMAGETDQIFHAVDKPIVNESKSDSGTESDVPAASSSSNMAVAKMVDKTTPKMVDYWKKMTATEADHRAYHSFGWLNSGLESSIPIMEYPIVDDTTVVCFESHLVAGLGHPPSKFLVAVMSCLGCELVHFNPNGIPALSCFIMLCECWLGIAPDTSLF